MDQCEVNFAMSGTDTVRFRAVTAWVGILVTCLTLVAQAKNIFDDDWVPPAVKAPSPPLKITPGTPSTSETTPAKPIVSIHRPADPLRLTELHHAVPTVDDQARSRKLFRELYARDLADRSTPARCALAQKLLEQSSKSSSVPSDQYVLLMGAMDAAREGNDLATSVRAIDGLASIFNLDSYPMKSSVALTLASRANASLMVNLDNCRVGMDIIEECLDHDDYATANRIIASLRPAAASEPSMNQQFQAISKQVEALRVAAAAIAKDREKLKSAPDDPAANLAVGKFLCFVKGDFKQGLPLLAKGGDSSLAAIAILEASGATGSEAGASLADGWWNAALKESTVIAKRGERGRAVFWYESVLSDLTGLRHSLAEQRIADFKKNDAPEIAATFQKVSMGKAYSVAATAAWVPTEYSVTEGKCYLVVAKGSWVDSRSATCGAQGSGPRESVSPMGPQPWMNEKQKADWYLGQHPRSSLIGRIGSEPVGFFVGERVSFIAPVTGKMDFRINDGESPSTVRAGKIDVFISEIQPTWLDSTGSAAVVARIDEVDILHFSKSGVYWEHPGAGLRVGEHEGHFPTMINGIYWWPTWNNANRSEVLKAPALTSVSRIQIRSVEARRGSVKYDKPMPDDLSFKFADEGLGASQVGCVLTFSR